MRAVVLTLIVLAAGSARADTVPSVRVELDAGAPVEGQLVGLDATTITVEAATHEVIRVPRDHVVRMTMLEPERVERMRVVGVQTSLLGTVVVDADYRHLRGFASASLLLPLITASGDNTYYAAAVGAGMSWPLSRHWNVDGFAQVVPFHTTSFYTYLGFGLGAGLHYTGASGFTFGITFPVVGFSTRLGSSPYGYDASFRYNDSIGYYYLGAVAGMPLVTLGYRFATNCPRR